ncbi:hypothetical protein EU527_02810 [Candidatus Thorarchaeota archaeon]|nr:MAG: hypothetical protein EU527_02810 [Candidatus Thorarchaeota archaeon]
MPSISDVREDAPGCCDYIEKMSSSYRAGFSRLKQDYRINTKALEKIKEYTQEFSIAVIFADWCGDAKRAVPVLAIIERETGKKIIARGGMTKPPYGSNKFWAVPPSPEEVDIFEITSSPTILIFNKEGEEIGRIKTRQKMKPTLEEEIVKIIEDYLGKK